MFGYAVANKQIMTEDEINRYREVYCGLCSRLKYKYGFTGRFALTYDMAFLILVLSSAYNCEGKRKQARCAVHPVKKHSEWTNEITDYAADMNIILAYHNAVDDVKDENNVSSKAKALLLSSKAGMLKNIYASKYEKIACCLKRLTQIEESGKCLPDEAGNIFGKVMYEVFLYKQDKLGEEISDMAFSLGKFIYILDACTDIKNDIKKNNYNPLMDMYNEKGSIIEFKEILEMLLGECAIKFEKLPISNDASIIKNILFSGIWLKYEAACNQMR